MDMNIFTCVVGVGVIVYIIYVINRWIGRPSGGYINNNYNNARNRNNSVSNRAANQNTGMMVYFANDQNNLSDNEYRFSYRTINGGWRAYILKSPSLNGRTASCHRLQDVNGPYICWSTEVYSLHEMQVIARRWADANQKFIATGISF